MDSEGNCWDIDECTEMQHKCEGLCLNTKGSYACACTQGYSMSSDRYTCIDKDECSVANGGCSHVCVNKAGSHSCSCPEGYGLSTIDNRTCVDVNECQLLPNACQQRLFAKFKCHPIRKQCSLN